MGAVGPVEEAWGRAWSVMATSMYIGGPLFLLDLMAQVPLFLLDLIVQALFFILDSMAPAPLSTIVSLLDLMAQTPLFL